MYVLLLESCVEYLSHLAHILLASSCATNAPASQLKMCPLWYVQSVNTYIVAKLGRVSKVREGAGYDVVWMHCISEHWYYSILQAGFLS